MSISYIARESHVSNWTKFNTNTGMRNIKPLANKYIIQNCGFYQVKVWFQNKRSKIKKLMKSRGMGDMTEQGIAAVVYNQAPENEVPSKDDGSKSSSMVGPTPSNYQNAGEIGSTNKFQYGPQDTPYTHA